MYLAGKGIVIIEKWKYGCHELCVSDSVKWFIFQTLSRRKCGRTSRTVKGLYSISSFRCCKGVWHEIFSVKSFHESVSPGPLSIPLGPFRTKLEAENLGSDSLPLSVLLYLNCIKNYFYTYKLNIKIAFTYCKIFKPSLCISTTMDEFFW